MLMRTPARLIAALAACLLAAACGREGKDGKTEYATDGDTGAAAPATVQVPSPGVKPDSTTGQAQATGKGMQAGDTLQAKGRGAVAPAVVPPATPKRP